MKRLILSLLPLLLAQCEASNDPAAPDATRDAVFDDAKVEVSDSADATSLAEVSDTNQVADTASDVAVDAADVAVDSEVTPSENGLTLVSSEGATVSPLTVVHLGLELADGIAAPARVEWSVVQPNGSQELFHPGATPLEATFAMNVVGGYRFAALAFDADGHTTASLSLFLQAVPGAGLYVELSWHTPGDFNESDVSDPFAFESAGSDVDLHLLHPRRTAPGSPTTIAIGATTRRPEGSLASPATTRPSTATTPTGQGPRSSSWRHPRPPLATPSACTSMPTGATATPSSPCASTSMACSVTNGPRSSCTPTTSGRAIPLAATAVSSASAANHR